MKFKSIFWLFNAVVVLALVLFVAASVFLFGRDYAAAYWANMWIVAVLFVILIGILDFYFIRNWQLFDFLEKEDWPALLAWLEGKIYVQGQLRRAYANLLINTALSVSNFDAVKKLETEVRQRKPEMLRILGVSLGIPVFLEQNTEAINQHFAPLAEDEKTLRRDWARWCRAYAAGAAGREELLDLLVGKDPSVRLLSLELIEQWTSKLSTEELQIVENARNELKTVLSGEQGKKALQRSREDHLMAVVLSSRVSEARDRLLVG